MPRVQLYLSFAGNSEKLSPVHRFSIRNSIKNLRLRTNNQFTGERRYSSCTNETSCEQIYRQ